MGNDPSRRKLDEHARVNSTTTLPAGSRVVRPSLAQRFRTSDGPAYNMKVIIRGDRQTGKSAMLKRFEGGSFESEHKATPQIQSTQIAWNYKTTDEMVKLEVWDVVDKAPPPDPEAIEAASELGSGSSTSPRGTSSSSSTVERRRMLSSSKHGSTLPADASCVDVYSGAHAVVLLVDPTRKWTLEYAERALLEIPSDLDTIVIFNKKDLQKYWALSPDELNNFLTKLPKSVRHLSMSLKDCFGMRELHTFLSVPFLRMKVRVLNENLCRAQEEFEQSEKEIELLMKEHSYDKYLQRMQQLRQAKQAARHSSGSMMISKQRTPPTTTTIGSRRSVSKSPSPAKKTRPVKEEKRQQPRPPPPSEMKDDQSMPAPRVKRQTVTSSKDLMAFQEIEKRKKTDIITTQHSNTTAVVGGGVGHSTAGVGASFTSSSSTTKAGGLRSWFSFGGGSSQSPAQSSKTAAKMRGSGEDIAQGDAEDALSFGFDDEELDIDNFKAVSGGSGLDDFFGGGGTGDVGSSDQLNHNDTTSLSRNDSDSMPMVQTRRRTDSLSISTDAAPVTAPSFNHGFHSSEDGSMMGSIKKKATQMNGENLRRRMGDSDSDDIGTAGVGPVLSPTAPKLDSDDDDDDDDEDVTFERMDDISNKKVGKMRRQRIDARRKQKMITVADVSDSEEFSLSHDSDSEEAVPELLADTSNAASLSAHIPAPTTTTVSVAEKTVAKKAAPLSSLEEDHLDEQDQMIEDQMLEEDEMEGSPVSPGIISPRTLIKPVPPDESAMESSEEVELPVSEEQGSNHIVDDKVEQMSDAILMGDNDDSKDASEIGNIDTLEQQRSVSPALSDNMNAKKKDDCSSLLSSSSSSAVSSSKEALSVSPNAESGDDRERREVIMEGVTREEETSPPPSAIAKEKKSKRKRKPVIGRAKLLRIEDTIDITDSDDSSDRPKKKVKKARKKSRKSKRKKGSTLNE